VAGGPFAQEFGEPRLVLNLLVPHGQRQVIRAMVLPRCVIADRAITTYGTAGRLHKDIQHSFDVRRVLGKQRRRASRNVMEFIHALGQLSAQFVIPWDQSLKKDVPLSTNQHQETSGYSYGSWREEERKSRGAKNKEGATLALPKGARYTPSLRGHTLPCSSAIKRLGVMALAL